MNKKIVTYFVLGLLFLFSACQKQGNPKQKAYFRISLPEKMYKKFISPDCGYSFNYPHYATVLNDTDPNSEPCWINIKFPDFKADIHISYKKINNNLEEYLEDSQTLVYKHVIKADAINEIPITNSKTNVYGIIYNIKGNAATPIQFYLTDSINHFLRASLYFNVHPNKDSLAPVIDFLISDIDSLVNSFEWN
jgi:gliding motility-associated lipoprotein GldD